MKVEFFKEYIDKSIFNSEMINRFVDDRFTIIKNEIIDSSCQCDNSTKIYVIGDVKKFAKISSVWCCALSEQNNKYNLFLK